MSKAAVAFVEFDGDFTKIGKQATAQSKGLQSLFAGSFKKIAEFGTAAVIGVGAGLVDVGTKFEDSFNTIARGTGAVGPVLDSLDQSFKDVLKSGSGSFDQVSQAITTLFQRTGLTGKALDDFAAKEVTLARITKTDVGENLQATTALFNLFGVAAQDQSAKLDVLFKASQVAGVTIAQLASDMQAAAPTAKILGLSIDQTASLVAQLDKAGLPASRVMQGLAATFVKAAKAGKSPLSVIHDLVAEVKAAPNATVAATVAIKKFGIGARQASTLVAGLRNGTIDLNTTLAGGKGILATAAATQTLSGAFANLKNQALVALEPIATRALEAVTGVVSAFSRVVPALIRFGTLVAVAFEVGFGRKTTDGIHGWVLIFATVGVVVERVISDVKSVLSGFGTFIVNAFHSAAFQTVVAATVQGFLFVRNTVDTVFRFVKGVLDKVGPPLEALFSKMTGFFSGSVGARVAAVAVALALLGTAAAAISSGFLTFGAQIASLLQGLSVLSSPLVLIALGLAVVAGAFFVAYKESKTFRDFIQGVAKVVTTAFQGLVTGFENPSARISQSVGRVSATFERLGQVAGKIIGALASFWEANGARIIATTKKIAVTIATLIGTGLLVGFTKVTAFLTNLQWGKIFDRVATDVSSAIARISQVVQPVVTALVPLGLAIGRLAVSLLPVLALAFRLVAAAMPTVLAAFFVMARVAGVVLGGALRVLAVLIDTLADHMNVLGPVLLTVAAGFGAFKAVKGAIGLVQTFQKSVLSTFGDLKAFGSRLNATATKFAGFFKAGGGSDALRLRLWAVRDAVKDAASALANGIKAALDWGKAAIATAIDTGKQVAAFVAQKVAALATAAAQKILTAAQWLLNAAMDANPITLVVAGLVLLGAAIFEAYQHFGPFRTAVEAVWQALQVTFNWVRSNWPLLLAILTGPIGLAILVFARNFDSIKSIVSGAFDAIVGFASRFWPVALAVLTGGLSLVVTAFIDHFGAIRDTVGGALNDVVRFFSDLPGRILAFASAVLAAASTIGLTIVVGVVQHLGTIVTFLAAIPGEIAQALAGLEGVIEKPFRNAFGWITRAWNDSVGHIFSLLFGSGSGKPPAIVSPNKQHPVPGVPGLAHGGVVTGPTLAIIGENATTAPEIVSPVKLMADTFRAVLLSIPAQTVVVGSKGLAADATGALKSVKDYLTALARVPAQVVTKVTADTKPAAKSYTDLVGAVTISSTPIHRATTAFQDLGASVATDAVRFKAASVGSTLKQLPVFDPGSGAKTGFTFGSALGGGVVRGVTTTINSIDVGAFGALPAKLTNPILAAIIAVADHFKTLQGVVTAGAKDVENHFGSTLKQLPVFDPQATKSAQRPIVQPVVVMPASVTRSAPTEVEIKQLQEAKAAQPPSIVGIEKQENHFEGLPPLEELAVLNSKLGARVALAGRR